jgi:antitoxin VapB
MGLNLKNPETEKLARHLAEITGENLTVAITVALKDRLENLDRAPRREGRLERLIGIVERTAPRFTDARPSTEIFDDLYDEAGLPK